MPINYGTNDVSTSGVITATSGVFTNINIIESGILTRNINDFNSSISGLLPVKHIVSGTDISVTNVSGIYTINSTVNTVAESASLVTTVFNKTGSPIPKMSAVYINGGQGDQPTVALAIATGDPTSAGTYGLTFESIPDMSTGKVVVFGALTGLNTDQFNPTAPHGDVNGQVLYLSPNVSGALTLTKPSAPNHIVALGTVVRTHQNEGVIEVRVQNGFELEELHNVAISGVTNGQFLQYSSGLWVPSSSGNFSTLLVNGTGVSLNGHTHTSSNITDFNSSVSGLLPITNITGGSNIAVSQSGTVYTVAVTGSLGLTTEEVDDRVSNLLTGGSYISLNYDDNNNLLTISATGLQPSGNYSVAGHSHTSSNISDFNSSVSGLLPTISNSGDNRVLTSTGSSVGIYAESNLTFDGTNLSAPYLISTNASGDEGGEIQLTKPPNGSLSGNIVIDSYQNKLRIFEQTGTSRGYYLDIASGAAGANTSLINKSICTFTPADNQPPATNYAILDTRNSILVLNFDANTQWSAVFCGVIPQNASLTNGLTVRIWWMGQTATSGNVRWGVSFEKTGTDNDADSFGTVTQATGAANGTSGIETVTSITATAIDSIATGDRFRLKVTRIADDATNDTMTGNAQLVAVEVQVA